MGGNKWIIENLVGGKSINILVIMVGGLYYVLLYFVVLVCGLFIMFVCMI